MTVTTLRAGGPSRFVHLNRLLSPVFPRVQSFQRVRNFARIDFLGCKIIEAAPHAVLTWQVQAFTTDA